MAADCSNRSASGGGYLKEDRGDRDDSDIAAVRAVLRQRPGDRGLLRQQRRIVMIAMMRTLRLYARYSVSVLATVAFCTNPSG
jgi:hypothetical protein